MVNVKKKKTASLELWSHHPNVVSFTGITLEDVIAGHHQRFSLRIFRKFSVQISDRRKTIIMKH